MLAHHSPEHFEEVIPRHVDRPNDQRVDVRLGRAHAEPKRAVGEHFAARSGNNRVGLVLRDQNLANKLLDELADNAEDLGSPGLLLGRRVLTETLESRLKRRGRSLAPLVDRRVCH
eukprot:Amastigsp_a512454_35.p3 type:complete len:116 gc:universal Amastigsp_a512454_35:415-68(-)